MSRPITLQDLCVDGSPRTQSNAVPPAYSATDPAHLRPPPRTLTSWLTWRPEPEPILPRVRDRYTTSPLGRPRTRPIMEALYKPEGHHAPLAIRGLLLFLILHLIVGIWTGFAVDVNLRPYVYRFAADSKVYEILEMVGCIAGLLLAIFDGLMFAYTIHWALDYLHPVKWVRVVAERKGGLAAAAARTALCLGFLLFLGVVVVTSMGLLVVMFWPLSVSPFLWRKQFKNTCEGLNVRVNSNIHRAGEVFEFVQERTLETFSMEFKHRIRDNATAINVLELGYYYGPFNSTSELLPSYDSIHYNLYKSEYTTFLNTTALSVPQKFTLSQNLLKVPALNLVADIGDFRRDRKYQPFLKVYDEEEEKQGEKAGWESNLGVVMRAAKFEISDRLVLCGRDMVGDEEANPILVGLIALLRRTKYVTTD